MQTRQINLKLIPSKIPLIALLIAFSFGYIISRYIPFLNYPVFIIFVIICISWLYKYLTFKTYNIVINTISNEVQVDQKVTHLVKFKHPFWWLSLIYLSNSHKIQKIYLFADSIPLKSYKSFRVYSRWI
jgi:hypothetical protein